MDVLQRKGDMCILCDTVVHDAGAHCVQCQQEHSLEHVRKAVSRGKTKCICKNCGESEMYAMFCFGKGLDTLGPRSSTNIPDCCKCQLLAIASCTRNFVDTLVKAAVYGMHHYHRQCGVAWHVDW